MTPDASVREQEILGEQVFRAYCAACHGVAGRGDGPRAARMTPRPRDFARGEFRFRTTPSGEAPTPSDLFRTVSGGLHGTRMMAFGDLPEHQIWAVVGHLQTLSDVFDDEPIPTEVPDAPVNLDNPERVQRGREVYQRLKCATCHGTGLRGDGPPKPTVENSRGEPIQVPDLSRHRLKRGNDPRALFATLATGLDGTPMPSYIDSTSPDELWDLVALLRNL